MSQSVAEISLSIKKKTKHFIYFITKQYFILKNGLRLNFVRGDLQQMVKQITQWILWQMYF